MSSMVVHAHLGENRSPSVGRSRQALPPHGPTYIIDNKGGLHKGGEAVLAPRKNPIVERVGGTGEGTGFSARIFIGLNVGDTPTYTIDDIVKSVVAISRPPRSAARRELSRAARGLHPGGQDRSGKQRADHHPRPRRYDQDCIHRAGDGAGQGDARGLQAGERHRGDPGARDRAGRLLHPRRTVREGFTPPPAGNIRE